MVNHAGRDRRPQRAVTHSVIEGMGNMRLVRLRPVRLGPRVVGRTPVAAPSENG